MNNHSGLYRDFVAQSDVFHVRKAVVKRAESASNDLNFPAHKVWTDAEGQVTEVTKGFLHFTGYARDDMVGRSCNFLQGKDTDPEDIREMRLAIQRKKAVCVVILNYCKNGNPFWNVLTIQPEYVGNRLEAFSSVTFGLPVPPAMRAKPKLCLEDALALINVFSTVPKTLPFALETSSVASSVTLEEEISFYKHIDYSDDSICSTPSVFDMKRLVFIAETCLPTDKGSFRLRAYRDTLTGAEPLALIHGQVEGQKAILARVHDQCVTSEVFGSLKCDCKQQLDHALEQIKLHSPGIVFYLPQEGRGIGIANKVAAYALQEKGLDTVDANRELGLPDDAREYFCVKSILEDLKVPSVKLMTNNPRKIEKLEELGVSVVERVECICEPNSDHSLNYIKAKAERMGHLFEQRHLQKKHTTFS